MPATQRKTCEMIRLSPGDSPVFARKMVAAMGPEAALTLPGGRYAGLIPIFSVHTMRFTRYERHNPVELNARRQAAFARKQARERDRYPLFSDHVAAEQHSLDEELARRTARGGAFEQRMRAFNQSAGATTVGFTLRSPRKCGSSSAQSGLPGSGLPPPRTSPGWLTWKVATRRAASPNAEPPCCRVRGPHRFDAGAGSIAGVNMRPTQEQSDAVASVTAGGPLRVRAYAGASTDHDRPLLRPEVVLARSVRGGISRSHPHCTGKSSSSAQAHFGEHGPSMAVSVASPRRNASVRRALGLLTPAWSAWMTSPREAP